MPQFRDLASARILSCVGMKQRRKAPTASHARLTRHRNGRYVTAALWAWLYHRSAKRRTRHAVRVQLPTASVLVILRRQTVTQDVQLFIAVQGYFKNLVDEIVIHSKLVQCPLEKFELHVEIHSVRSVQADESRVNRHVGVLPFRSRLGCGSAEVDGISSHEDPVAVEDEGLELPVLLPVQASPNNMRRLPISLDLRELGKFGTQAFVDQEFHFVF